MERADGEHHREQAPGPEGQQRDRVAGGAEAGRAFVEAQLSLDHYIQRMSNVIAPAPALELVGATV